MRRESVATLKVKHLDRTGWLRGVLVKGGTTRDIPLPESVVAYLLTYAKEVLHQHGGKGHARDAAVLVEVGSPRRRPDDAANDRQESMAAHQVLRPFDWRAGAQAT
jgi:hypothetical protein